MSQQQEQGFLQQSHQSGSLSEPVLGLFELVDRILDKGLVVEAYISVTVIGIPLVVVRARIVVAGLDTFLRYQDAMGLKGEPGEKVEQRVSPPHQQQQIPIQQGYGGYPQQGYSMAS